MTKFERGLSTEFVDALNDQYVASDSWWRPLVEDPTLFIGIRNNRLNVYFNGASLLDLKFSRGKLIGDTNFKFLIRDKPRSWNVKFEEGYFKQEDLAKITFSQDIRKDIAAIKKASKPYHKPEAVDVYKIIRSNDNVIDTEVVFADDRIRIDFAAFRNGTDRPQLVFYEAKRFANPEIFGEHPSVVEQVARYRDTLSNAGRIADISSSYIRVAENIVALQGFKRKLKDLSKKVVHSGLDICPNVRLTITGFDRAQQKDAKVLFARLRNLIGEKMVLTKGSAKGLVQGISE